MRLDMTPEGFLRSQVANVGFYPCVISAYEEKLSERKPDSPPNWQQSTTAHISLRVTTGPQKGKVFKYYINEKAPEKAKDLLVALGDSIDVKKKTSREISEAALVGQHVNAHVIKRIYMGKEGNEVDGFAKYTGPTEYSFEPDELTV